MEAAAAITNFSLCDSPFPPPDWRWRRALSLASEGRYATRRRADTSIVRATHYLRALGRATSRRRLNTVLDRYNDLHQARQLTERRPDDALLVELQARLLTGQPTREICEHVGLTAEGIDTFESVFFAVRERLRYGDWITLCAVRLGECDADGRPSKASLIRLLAYVAGPLALEAARAYLIDNKDWSTRVEYADIPTGRLDQAVQTWIEVNMLPRGPKGDKIVAKLHLELLRQTGNERSPAEMTAVVARTVAERLESIARGTAENFVRTTPTPATGTVQVDPALAG